MFSTETLTAEALELLGKLIATPRTSRNEEEAANLLADFIDGKRFASDGRKFYDIHREANNIWCIASDYDAARPTLLLNAHIDTVKPVSAWTRDPFTPTWEGDRLYGLGANDDGSRHRSVPITLFIWPLPKRKCLGATAWSVWFRCCRPSQWLLSASLPECSRLLPRKG